MRLDLITPAAADPVSLDEAKAHLRVEHDREDTLIRSAIKAATLHAQVFTRRQFVSAFWTVRFDRFPERELRLPLPPLRSVAQVSYRDPSGLSRIWNTAEYVVDAPRGEHAAEGRIFPEGGGRFPQTFPAYNAVAIQFTAGYGDPADVPAGIKHAILLGVGDLYDHRSTVAPGPATSLPLTAERLLWPYRVLEWS